MAGILIATSAASAAGLDTYPADPTEAEASIVDLTLNGSDLIGLASSHAGSVSDPGPNREAFSGSILGGEIVDFGSGFTIPLDQLIDFGQAGVLLSESTATDGRNGEAISGLAGADGGLTLDGADGDFGAATIDLLSLFSAAGVDGVTDLAVDQADFTFGLGGAWVEAIDGVFQDPDAVGGAGQYRVVDAKLVLHSPVIEQAADGVSDAAGQMEDAILDIVNPLLGLGALLPGATVTTSITSDLQQDVLDAVILAPISTDDGLATIDIGAGTVTVDIGRIGGNDDGVIPGRPTGINNQNPNTELIDDTTYPFIASSIHDVIEEVINVATEAAVASLETVNISVDVTSPLGLDASWDMNLAGDVTNYTCTGGFGNALCIPVNAIIPTLPAVLAPALDMITDPNSPTSPYAIFTTVKTDLITVPIRAVLDPFIEIVAGFFSVQLNHQETQVCTPAGGADTLSGLEVSALSFGVLGGAARLGIGNAGLRVDACNLAGPSLSVSSPVPAGGSIAVTSGGWTPNAQVTLQLTAPDGITPVGDPVAVTADATGTVPADTVVPVPADAVAGDYTVVGSAPGEGPLTANLTVYAPTLEAQSPVAPGDCSAITSGGWLPNALLTLQLENATGDPAGAALPVTADADGNVPAGTCMPIPADAPEGDYTVVGTDENGTERTDTVTVQIGAITPNMSVTSPAPAGGATTVTSDGWNPDSEVSLQLTDPEGNPAGAPVVVTTDAAGIVPPGTTVPVPADALAGDYTVVGTDPDDNTVSAPLAVYAPTLDAQSPVAPGACSALVSDGWLPNSSVLFQLRNAVGDLIGSPVAVIADADGVIPAGTCVQIPADAPEGDYEVEGTDGTAVVTDPIVVDAAALTPTLALTSPVPAGGESTVTSDGWNPDSEVSLQLTDPEGNALGAPVVVTTDGTGTVPDGTVVPVPEGSPAGDYTVVATDPDGNNATAPLAVYAPTLSATSPVPAGGSTTVTSAGWLPNTPVTLQLMDGAGNPVGDPVPVTTDAEGDVPDGTTVPVPLTATPGADYSVVGSDANGAEAADTIEVTAAAISPTLDASSPVPAGGETTVVSGGWIPGSQVSLQLTDPAGDPVGEPVLAMADGEGDLPTGTTVPVPANAPAGDDYSVVATDLAGNEASDVLIVYVPVIDAASPVPAGGTSAVTSSGWIPNSAVTLQLTDGAGTPVGEPVPVTTDGTGAVPAGTTVPVPAGTTPGTDYEVVATDGIAEVSDIIEVTAAGINPTISATSPVPAGGETTVTSAGWNPASEVSLQLTDSAGDPVGAPVVVTTEGDGSIPDGTTVPVPADAVGDYTVVATDPDDVQVSAPLAVYSPMLEATSPVPAGGSTTVTSAGWLPNTAVDLQLVDPDGNPMGDPVPVTTDAEGDVPEGTTVPVPLTATPGAGYSVVGTDANGAEAADTIEVTAAAISPTLDASSPAPAGGETTIVSGGWIPGSQVSLQLLDPAGDPAGAPVPVMADGEGDLPTGTTVPIPADGPAGDYTVVGTDLAGNEASDVLDVYAPTLDVQTPVAPGTCALVEESGGWLPNTPVTLQLTDAGDNPVGDPVTVMADADGNLPTGTCVPIPEDAAPGDYEVVGTDENGAEVTAPVTVDPDAINPTITATSPVPAGGETTVDSDGWTPGAQVTLQLVDPADSPLGDPVEVTAGDDGSIPSGTTVPVPLTAAPGEGYSVTATDENAVEVSAPLEVTAAVLTPTLSASSPAPAGGATTIQSTGWVPGSDITLQLVDDAGNPVGEPVEVMADPTGAVPAGTTVPIPADADAGDYAVDAVDEFGNEASAPLSIYAPAISATSPVVAGGATEVTSSGWLPNTEVELRLTDGVGDPIGDPVTVMTDADGVVPPATTVPVPESTPAGTEYYVVGTDDNGAEVADQIEVLAAGSAPTLQASSPVPAGGESAITSSGWEPGAEVTLVLTDAGGNPVGDPVVVTANGEGALPDGTVVPVPADADAGTFTIEASDGEGDEASAPLSVYAPDISATSPVPAGGSTTVTSTGWMPNTEVTLQLANAGGNPVGDELNVMADGAGVIPAGTTLPVPADAPAGAYSVIGTDAGGAEVSAAIDVTPAGTGLTLSASSPVPAGGETTVTATGWEPGANVSLQLTNSAGDPVGAPVNVTVGEDGSIPAGTTVPVPADATAGTYWVVGTDEDDNTASAALAVYAPRLLATSPVPAGGSSQITSDGWMPNSEVTLQLVDGDGEPVGDPVVVMANGAGALPAGTSVLVPAGAAPGDYAITAVDETGAALETALAVTAATAGCANPTITVNPTAVAPGKTVTVTGTGFAAGGTATVQLYDANGKALLDPALTLAVGESCGFTITVKVPAGAAAGVYKIVATDDAGNAASANLTVTGGTGGGLAATGGDPGVHLPLALILIALGAAVLLVRRSGVVADKQ